MQCEDGKMKMKQNINSIVKLLITIFMPKVRNIFNIFINV